MSGGLSDPGGGAEHESQSVGGGKSGYDPKGKSDFEPGHRGFGPDGAGYEPHTGAHSGVRLEAGGYAGNWEIPVHGRICGLGSGGRIDGGEL